MRTRAVIGLMVCLAWAWLLGGCGGGGGGSPFVNDAEVAGRWLQIDPRGESGILPDADGYWPTRALTLGEDGTFLLEEGAPEQRTAGSYRAEGGVLTFAREGTQGTAALAGTEASYAFLDGQLIISEETPAGSRAYRFARVVDATPPLLVGEWLVARRLSAEGAETPCLASTRLTIDVDGGIAVAEDDGAPATRQGSVLVAASGHLGMRLPAAGASAGRLRLLGAYTADTGMLLMHGDDGARIVCARRAAPDTRLIGQWELQTGAEQLTLNSDGTYVWTSAGGSGSGGWRSYYGGYLCLLTPTAQRAFATAFWGPSSAILTLGHWVPHDGSGCYEESSWERGE